MVTAPVVIVPEPDTSSGAQRNLITPIQSPELPSKPITTWFCGQRRVQAAPLVAPTTASFPASVMVTARPLMLTAPQTPPALCSQG